MAFPVNVRRVARYRETKGEAVARVREPEERQKARDSCVYLFFQGRDVLPIRDAFVAVGTAAIIALKVHVSLRTCRASI